MSDNYGGGKSSEIPSLHLKASSVVSESPAPIAISQDASSGASGGSSSAAASPATFGSLSPAAASPATPGSNAASNSALAVVPTAKAGTVSPDGSCGAPNGYTCVNAYSGACCMMNPQFHEQELLTIVQAVSTATAVPLRSTVELAVNLILVHATTRNLPVNLQV